MNVGYIYILSNPMMPGLIKIGITSREVRQRAAELSSTTGVPAPFEVEYYCLTSSPEEVEVNVHKHFASHRAPGREFFAIALRLRVPTSRSFFAAAPRAFFRHP